jgi:VanZ family protein
MARVLTLVAAASFAAFIGAVIILADLARLGPLLRFYSVPHGDKAGHFILYGPLALLVELAVLQSFPQLHARRLVLIVAGTITMLVLAEELSQAIIPARSAGLVDLAAGLAGIAAASCAALPIGHFLRRNARVSGGPE